MSGAIGGAQIANILSSDDRRLCPAWFQRETEHPFDSPDRGGRNEFWPRSGFEGDPTVDGFMAEAKWYEWPYLVSGSVSRVGYRGVTRDENNSPMGGVTVKIFRTADDTKQADDVVSDASGNFVISTPYYEAHYLVMRKAGAPEFCGLTISSQFPNT